MDPKKEYINLTHDGRYFPIYVPHNFKKYKLAKIFHKEGDDPCNVEIKLEFQKYQRFIGDYLGPTSVYNEILLYHGLGSGKTATVINLINIMHWYDNTINYVLLVKASLDETWMVEFKKWLSSDPSGAINVGDAASGKITNLPIFKNIHIVHYDSPFADRDFINVMKGIDSSKRTMYIIDEAHNFIRNVYSNMNSKSGKRAQVIYDYIAREKQENNQTKIVLISATPVVNVPFELALIFNLLRPNTFPSSEMEFNRIFITNSTYPILNPLKRNIFMRRILSLVSYYIGSTPDRFAHQTLTYVNLPMSHYQYEIYRFFEKIEEDIQKKAKRVGKTSQLYRTYTRQACNFVFPRITGIISPENRPRPGQFRRAMIIADDLDKGKEVKFTSDEEKEIAQKYMLEIKKFIDETEKWFNKLDAQDKKDGHTLQDDLLEFKNMNSTKFLDWYNSSKSKAGLTIQLYECSPKMTAILFMSYMSPGKVMIYTNYVIMEGIDIMKIYLKLGGFSDYTNAKKFMGFCEYHGRISSDDRTRVKSMYNESNNTYGEHCKIILLSPSAAEGIQLFNIRQEHILEPYWTEVRMQQVIGRGIRQCSHRELPMDQRTVDVYRYKVTKPIDRNSDDFIPISTDQHVEDQAKAKSNLNESFLSALKEAAVDCELFREHNMMAQSYKCFTFPDSIYFDKNVGPAYKEDLKEDVKIDLGLYAANSKVERVKVLLIKAVYSVSDTTYSAPSDYWYNPKTGIVYDYEAHYPVGKIEKINGLSNKLNKDTYIISHLIDIPTIIGKTVNP